MKRTQCKFLILIRKGVRIIGLPIILAIFIPITTCAQVNHDSSRVSNITLGIGVLDLAYKSMTCGGVEVNYFAKKQFWIFSPFAGCIVSTNTSYSLYAGVVVPFRLARDIYINCSFAPAIWSKQDGNDLGCPLEFRTGVDFSILFKNKVRLGIEFTHFSNANISNYNPGMENLSVFIGIPLNH